MARLGPRADATGRSTNGAKIDVLSACSAGTRNVERDAQTGELERSSNRPGVWARGASAWGSDWHRSASVGGPGGLPKTQSQGSAPALTGARGGRYSSDTPRSGILRNSTAIQRVLPMATRRAHKSECGERRRGAPRDGGLRRGVERATC